MKKRIRNISSTTIFGVIILIAIITIFIVTCLLPSKDVNAAGVNMDPNPTPIEKLDSANSNISVVPNTKWGTHYADDFDLVYDLNTNIIMYQYNGSINSLQPMLGPNGYPCRLEGNNIVETQTNQFVLSTE